MSAPCPACRGPLDPSFNCLHCHEDYCAGCAVDHDCPYADPLAAYKRDLLDGFAAENARQREEERAEAQEERLRAAEERERAWEEEHDLWR